MEIMSTEYTHHHLITNMQISLNEIVEVRKRLEAIGLLKTYFKDDTINNFAWRIPHAIINLKERIAPFYVVLTLA